MSNGVKENEEYQSDEGYGCQCGYKTNDVKAFRSHLMSSGKRKNEMDDAGNPVVHKSLGRINMNTGDVVMPPFNERTKEQKQATVYGLRQGTQKNSFLRKEEQDPDDDGEEESKPRKTGGSSPSTGKTTLQTSDPGLASAIKVVPRVMTMDYSPTLRMAQSAAVREWGWAGDMPLVNFIDTCLYHFFKEHGIVLAGYIVTDTQREEENAEKELVAA